MPNPPLSVSEASGQTGIPKRTLQAAIARGDLKAHKFSGHTGAFVIDPDDLDAYLASRNNEGACP